LCLSKKCKQPIKEEYLLTGKLEKTNDAYAIAKIAGIKMCESYNFQYKTKL
jgi:GDP-L-fucose synthase